MKKRRHAKILELINSHDIETQEELTISSLKQRNLRGTYAVPRKEPCIG